MSWRRGFYRLWIVATVVWLVGVIFVLRPDKAAVDYFVLTFVRTPNSSVEVWYPFISTKDLTTIKNTALVGIVPALGVLALGEFLGWAMRGFRARHGPVLSATELPSLPNPNITDAAHPQ